jgi:hypothetical protein
MIAIRSRAVPSDALLARYRVDGHYVDAYSADVSRRVAVADYVVAFYTTPVFKLERLILKHAVAKPSTDADARALADGRADAFAAWTVEARAADELLLGDYTGRTRSWLRVEPLDGGTRLWFGSAVVAVRDRATGRARLGAAYTALLGFHKLYSRVLLGAAARRATTP